MEDGDPLTSDQYFPDIGGLKAFSGSIQYLMTELAMNSFEQSLEWHYDRFPHSSTSLLLPLAQPSVPEQHMLESDTLITPDMSHHHYSTSTHHDTVIESQGPVSSIIPRITGTWNALMI